MSGLLGRRSNNRADSTAGGSSRLVSSRIVVVAVAVAVAVIGAMSSSSWLIVDNKVVGVHFLTLAHLLALSISCWHTLLSSLLSLILCRRLRRQQQQWQQQWQVTQVVSPASPNRGGATTQQTASRDLPYHRSYNCQPRGFHSDAAPQAAGPASYNFCRGSGIVSSNRGPALPLRFSPAKPIKHVHYKTEMCKNILNNRCCGFGASCNFAHCAEELQERKGGKDEHMYPCLIMVSTGHW
jgi:hypothetical protein